VKVDWYYDQNPAVNTTQEASSGLGAWRMRNWTALGIIAGAAVMAIAVTLLLRRIWRGEKNSQAERDEDEPATLGLKGEEVAEPLPFAFLKEISSEQILTLVRSELPQTIALVLAHVGPAKAASVLGSLSRDQQVDVVRRLAGIDRIDADVAAAVESGLASRMAGEPAQDASSGLSAVAEILHSAGYETESSVLAALNESQPELAQSIRGRLYSFEDIASTPAELIRTTVASIDIEDLAVALRTASREVLEHVRSSLDAQTAQKLLDETEQIGPVRLCDVESAQQRVMDAIRSSRSGRYVPAQSPATIAREDKWQS
jgi:flagellar motor switch protein FliG